MNRRAIHPTGLYMWYACSLYSICSHFLKSRKEQVIYNGGSCPAFFQNAWASPKPLSSRADRQGVFRPLRRAARALPLTCELLKKFDQNFYFGVHIVFQQTVSALPVYITLSQKLQWGVNTKNHVRIIMDDKTAVGTAD